MKKYNITEKELDNISNIVLEPGDELVFENVTFYPNKQITIQCNGTKELPIIIGGLDFEHRPIFDFRNQPYGVQTDPDCNGFRIIGENLIIENMIICYSGFKGLKLETKNSTIKNIETYGCCDSGIHIISGGNNKVVNCDSHDNFGYKENEGRYRKTPFGFSSDGISDKLHEGDPDIFIGCRSWNNTDDGFDFYGRICKNGKIEMHNCWAFNNGKSSFNMTNYPRYNIDRIWFNPFKNGKYTELHNIKINTERVLCSLENYPAFGNGNGFKLGGIFKNNNISLFSCISIGNKGKGFDQNNNSGEMILNKCYAADNGLLDYGFRKKSYGNLVLENCESKGKNTFLCKKSEHGENKFNTNEETRYSIDVLTQKRDSNGNLPELIK